MIITKKILWFAGLLLCLTPWSYANGPDLNDEDLTTFRNDLVIPRLLIHN